MGTGKRWQDKGGYEETSVQISLAWYYIDLAVWD